MASCLYFFQEKVIWYANNQLYFKKCHKNAWNWIFFCSCLNFMDYALLCAIIISFHHYFAKQSFLRGEQSNSNWNLFILRFEGVYFLYKTCWMEVRFASWENWWILGPLMSLVLFSGLLLPSHFLQLFFANSKELFEVSSLMISPSQRSFSCHSNKKYLTPVKKMARWRLEQLFPILTIFSDFC